jgi:RNA polymerase sigma factor (sigma-70 family)
MDNVKDDYKEFDESRIDSLTLYLREIGFTPLLTKGEEKNLAKLSREGDKEARKLFIECNLRLVVKVAESYTPNIANGVFLLDIIQEGNLGLIHAVSKYDERKGFRFSTYAVWWIKQSMSRAFANKAELVRLPVHSVRALYLYKRKLKKLVTKLGREATCEELVEYLEMPLNHVNKLKQMDLSRALPEQIDDLQERNPCDILKFDLFSIMQDLENNISDEIEKEDLANYILSLLDELPPREKSILTMRYGLGCDEMTLEAIGEILGITKERVRQLQEEAINKIKALVDPSLF